MNRLFKTRLLAITAAVILMLGLLCGTVLATEDPEVLYVNAGYENGDSDGTEDKPFVTLSAAVEAVDEDAAGAIICVAAGTYAETVTIGKSLTILGVNADNDARSSAFLEAGSIVTGGIEITGGEVTIKGLTIKTKGILASNFTGLTVINNRIQGIKEAMEGSPAASIVGLDVKRPSDGPIVIKQNRFVDIGKKDDYGAAVRAVQAKKDITISDNIIENVTWNGINLYSSCLANDNAVLTITGNEIIDWDSDKDQEQIESGEIGGRAIRIDFVGANSSATANITNNKLVPPVYAEEKVPVDKEYIKLTTVGISVDLTKNYWGSAFPDFETILLVTGVKASECSFSPWYANSAMTELATAEVKNIVEAGEQKLIFKEPKVTMEMKIEEALEDAHVSVTRYVSDEKGAPEGMIPAGIYLRLERSENLAETAVRISVTYDAAGLPEGVSEDDLKLYRYNEDTGKWELITKQGIDKDNSLLWAELDSFSIFGIFADAPEAPPVDEPEPVKPMPDKDTPQTHGGLPYFLILGLFMLLSGILLVRKEGLQRK